MTSLLKFEQPFFTDEALQRWCAPYLLSLGAVIEPSTELWTNDYFWEAITNALRDSLRTNQE